MLSPFACSPARLRTPLLSQTAILAAILSARLITSQASAQSVTPVLQPDKVTFDFYERGPYRSEVPRPATVLRYQPGEFHTTYANYERFLHELAPKTDRLRVLTVGETPEHRLLYVLVVSSPENLARLDAIETDLALLADHENAVKRMRRQLQLVHRWRSG